MSNKILNSFSDLKQAFSAGTSPLRILSKSSSERQWIVRTLLGLNSSNARFFDAKEDSSDVIQEALLAPTFFSGQMWTVIDNAETLTLDIDMTSCILLGEKLPLKGPGLDLRTEKPWDRKKRLVHHFMSENKPLLDQGACETLYDLTLGDPWLMEQEIAKCLCYTEGKAVERATIELLCNKNSATHLFKISENMAFGLGSPPPSALPDKNDLYALIGQLRYHYKIGLALAENREVTNNLTPRTLNEYRTVAKARGAHYFVQALLTLFTLELKTKTTTLSMENLYTKFLHDTLSLT